MDKAATVKAPASFWIVGLLSLLWNGFGGFDYLMTRLRDMDYLAGMAGSAAAAETMLAQIEAMPLWVSAAWGIGVWGSVLGAVLLLARSRHAVPAFLVSLIAAALSFAHQMTLTMPPELDTPAMKIMPLFILAVIVLQWWYARRQVSAGILR